MTFWEIRKKVKVCEYIVLVDKYNGIAHIILTLNSLVTNYHFKNNLHIVCF